MPRRISPPRVSPGRELPKLDHAQIIAALQVGPELRIHSEECSKGESHLRGEGLDHESYVLDFRTRYKRRFRGLGSFSYGAACQNLPDADHGVGVEFAVFEKLLFDAFRRSEVVVGLMASLNASTAIPPS